MFTRQRSVQMKVSIVFNGREKVRIKTLKSQSIHQLFIPIDDVYQTLEDQNPTKIRRVLIVFDDMIADMESKKQLSPIVPELFLR